MPRLQISVFRDYETLSHGGADLVAELIAACPSARVVVATGETPMGLYGELARRRAAGSFDPASITVFQLDEYVGIGPDDRRSLVGWTERSVLGPLGIRPDRFVLLPADGNPQACAAYDRRVEDAGGYDLAILGVGTNGHIGFNEPPSDASAPTREVVLTPASIASNAGYWGREDRVPDRAITIGMAPLLRARTILLIASGERKGEVVRRTLLGPVTPEVPASHLQEADDVRVLVDRAAWNGTGGSTP